MVSTFTITVNLPAIINSTGHFLPTVIGIIVTIVSAIEAFLQKYQADISSITLAIEKADEDGTITNEEKKQIADDIYFNILLPKISGKWFWLKLIPKPWVKRWIGNLIDDMCNKAKSLQSAVPIKPVQLPVVELKVVEKIPEEEKPNA